MNKGLTCANVPEGIRQNPDCSETVYPIDGWRLHLCDVDYDENQKHHVRKGGVQTSIQRCPPLFDEPRWSGLENKMENVLTST